MKVAGTGLALVQRIASLLILGLSLVAAAAAQPRPVTTSEPAGQALVERLRQGGLVLFFRHADTSGMSCDRRYRLDERAGQRNLSEAGRAQSEQIGAEIRALGIPVDHPVLAGPVFRARDTAELAFGRENVERSDSLLADDYASAGGRSVHWIIEEHRRLFSESPPPGTNRILVGHRTPALSAIGGRVGQEELNEGAAIVLDPIGNGQFDVLGVLALSPVEAGENRC